VKAPVARRFPGLFVTGTDTDAGKTFVAAMILRTLAAKGIGVGAAKPVASGVIAGGPSDAQTLWEAAGRPRTLSAVCPQAFALPLAPHHAARAEGRTIDETLLREGVLAWTATSECLIVEGAGGLFSPLTDRLLNADLAADLGVPLIVVDSGRLGCVGRVLATCFAAESRGLGVAAVVLSQIDPGGPIDEDAPTSPGRIARDGAEEIARHLPRIAVAVLPHAAAVTAPPLDWLGLARG
jgi:dethiobiotin synthetase